MSLRVKGVHLESERKGSQGPDPASGSVSEAVPLPRLLCGFRIGEAVQLLPRISDASFQEGLLCQIQVE